MNSTSNIKNYKTMRALIIVLSVAIPLIVAVLFGVKIEGVDLSFLPPIYAGINGLTAFFLLAALYAIRSHNMNLHKKLINVCMILSLLFLAGYVAYHMTSDPTVFGDSNGDGVRDGVEGDGVKYLIAPYYFLLVSHILLSIAVVPMVLFSYLYAWTGNFEKHRKWTKITFPIWLYVALSGVVVFVLINPYY
jgi:putative membrane protein